MIDKTPSPGFVAVVVLVLAISACSNPSDDAREQFEADVQEGIVALQNEGWSQTPIVAATCEYGDAETPTDRCMAFAAYLDAGGCPAGAFSSGFLRLVSDYPDLLHPAVAAEWADIGARFDCSIDLAAFNAQTSAPEEPTDANAAEEPTEEDALAGPTEESALEFVSSPVNQPAFAERFSAPMFTQPRVSIEARIDGNCAAVRFHEGGESKMEPWTGFLFWEDGEWHLRSVTLIPDAITLLEGC